MDREVNKKKKGQSKQNVSKGKAPTKSSTLSKPSVLAKKVKQKRHSISPDKSVVGNKKSKKTVVRMVECDSESVSDSEFVKVFKNKNSEIEDENEHVIDKNESQLKSMLTKNDMLCIAQITSDDLKGFLPKNCSDQDSNNGNNEAMSSRENIEQNTNSQDDENASGHNNVNAELTNARAQADKLIDNMSKQNDNVRNEIQNRDIADMRQKESQDGEKVYHLTASEINDLVEQSKNLDKNSGSECINY